MKKILILVAIVTTLAMANHWIYITQPDGTVLECMVWDNGNIVCN